MNDGPQPVKPGDRIVLEPEERQPGGDVELRAYPVDPDVFDRTYEPAPGVP